MLALKIVNAKKNFKDLQALKGINLEIKRGEFFGLLGPNGAGKTTLINSIVGLCRLSEGEIKIFDFNVANQHIQANQLLGFSPQDVNLDRFFTIRKLLIYQAGIYGIERKMRAKKADELLEMFGLIQKADIPYYRLSGGMQKRLLIARAVISNPQILILDEPTAGVDVEQRHHLWKYLTELKNKGTTIILTTHYIDEAETLCEKIGIINLGEIKEIDSPQNLIDRYCEKKVFVKTEFEIENSDLKNLNLQFKKENNCLWVYGSDVGKISQSIYELIIKNQRNKILDMHVEKGSLEDVFLKLTGTKL